MPPAARKMDPTVHGGKVVEGSPDTFIGNQAAARLLDKHVCPLHGPGPILQTSFTVYINGVGAARMGDACICMVPSTGKGGGGGDKPKQGSFKITGDLKGKKKFGEEKAEWKKEGGEGAADKDKKKPEKELPFEPKLSKKVETKFGKFGNADQKKGNFEKHVYSGEGSASAEGELSARRVKASAQAGYEAKYTGAQAQGQLGDVKKGSVAQVTAKGEFLTAKANATASTDLEIKDGRLAAANVGAEAGIGASVFEAKATAQTKGFRIPLTNYKISFGGEASLALATLEARASANAGYKDNKWTFSIGAKLGAALAGIGGKLSFSIERDEPKEPAPPPAGAPGVAGIDPIAMGCLTVLIGGVPPPYIPGAPAFVMPGSAAGAGPTGMNRPVVTIPVKPTPEDYKLAAEVGETLWHVEARARVAKAFYQQNYPDMTPAKINSHMSGIDLTRPVEVVMVPPPNAMEQHLWPGSKPSPGNYFALPNTPSTNLGINPSALNRETGLVEPRPIFAVKPDAMKPVLALQSIAAPVLDTWSDEPNPYMTKGGAPQWNIPQNDVVEIVRPAKGA